MEATVIAPNILDGHGIRTSPANYDIKFEDGMYVKVEVYLKLYISCFVFRVSRCG